MFRSAIVSGVLTALPLFTGVHQVGAQLQFGTPERLGPNINDPGDWEAGPSLSHDGLEFFFTGGPGRKLYFATRETTESEFGPRQMIRDGGHPSVSADGLSLYYHRGGNPDDLWVMTRDTIEDDWTQDENLGRTVNSQYDDMAPSISADGLELYFRSDRPNGNGAFCVWETKRQSLDSPWEEPTKVEPCMTGGPEIAADGLTLFFTASGRAGSYGGSDMWMVRRDTTDGPWGEPVNLGPEVNTSDREINAYLSADGAELYFSRGDIWDISELTTWDLWRAPVILPHAVDALQAGDADQNHSFDQLDLVRVLQTGKYLTGEPVTWGEGDWDGAPGGSVGDPPAGDGLFDQLDIVKALASGLYMSGPYAAVRPEVDASETHASVGNDATTGETGGDAPDGTELASASIASAAGVFTLAPAENPGGSFDDDTNVFKATFGNCFGSLSFGNVAQPGLEEELLLGDLTVVGSLPGGRDQGNVDLLYVPVPEPASILLLSLGVLVVACKCRRVSGRRPF